MPAQALFAEPAVSTTQVHCQIWWHLAKAKPALLAGSAQQHLSSSVNDTPPRLAAGRSWHCCCCGCCRGDDSTSSSFAGAVGGRRVATSFVLKQPYLEASPGRSAGLPEDGPLLKPPLWRAALRSRLPVPEEVGDHPARAILGRSRRRGVVPAASAAFNLYGGRCRPARGRGATGGGGGGAPPLLRCWCRLHLDLGAGCPGWRR